MSVVIRSTDAPRTRRGPLLRDWRQRAAAQPARPGAGGRDLDEASELRRDRPLAAEPGDGAAPRRPARGAAARAQPAAAGGRLRAPLRRRGRSTTRRWRRSATRSATCWPATSPTRRSPSTAHWNLVASNAALGPLLEGVAPELLQPPVNCIRLALHPDGLAPRILNLAEWRSHLLHRLDRECALTGDPSSSALLDEVLALSRAGRRRTLADAGAIMVELRAADPAATASWRSSARSRRSGPPPTSPSPSCRSRPFFPADADTAERAARALSGAAGAGSSAGFCQPPSAGLTFVPGGTISSIRSSTSSDSVDVGRGQLRLEVLHRARADDRRGHRRVADHERERHLDQRHARPPRPARASASAASSLRWLSGIDRS